LPSRPKCPVNDRLPDCYQRVKTSEAETLIRKPEGDTKEMKSRLLMWLVIALIGTGVQAQTVTTLNPSAFASGTDVSNAFAGVTLSAMTLVSDGSDPVTGIPLWTPTYAPVYAVGNLFTSSSTASVSLGTANSWGPILQPVAGDCFNVCSGGQVFLSGTELLASFNTPISLASVLQIDNDANGDFMQAFNSADQLVAYCLPPIFAQQPVGNYGCYSVVNSDFINYQEVTSVTAPDISKILMGGYNNGGEIGVIKTVRVPEIDPASAASGLTLLLGGLMVLRGRRPVTFVVRRA
jgi:hypothetical protein